MPTNRFGRGALHRVTARHRSGECHEIDAWVADHTIGVVMIHVQDLEYALGQPRLAEALREPLRAERRLRRMLEQHYVSGQDRRDDAVDGDQVRVVPRRHRQHDPQRLAAQKARESGLAADVDVRDRLRPDLDHVPRPLERPADLVRRVTDRPTHLPAELGRDRVATCLERGAEARQDRGTRSTGTFRQALKRTHRPLERVLDLRRAGKLALDVHAAVDWTDGALRGHQRRLAASDSCTQVGA